MHTFAKLPGLNGSNLKTNSQGRFIVKATNHITTTANLYLLLRREVNFIFPYIKTINKHSTYVCVILPDKNGKLIAAIRSNEIAVRVLTDADTDTPCK